MTGRLSSAELFGPERELHEELRRAQVGAIAVRTLGGSMALAGSVTAELARACTDLVDIDLVSVALNGWRLHRDVQAAAVRTAAAPGSIERVTLAEHCITSSHRPRIEVSLDGLPPTCIPVEVTLRIVLQVVDATIRAGRLVALESGDATISGTLTASGVLVSAPPTRRIELGRRIDLGDGLPLLTAQPAT